LRGSSAQIRVAWAFFFRVIAAVKDYPFIQTGMGLLANNFGTGWDSSNRRQAMQHSSFDNSANAESMFIADWVG
jgi:hypothetical protein